MYGQQQDPEPDAFLFYEPDLQVLQGRYSFQNLGQPDRNLLHHNQSEWFKQSMLADTNLRYSNYYIWAPYKPGDLTEQLWFAGWKPMPQEVNFLSKISMIFSHPQIRICKAKSKTSLGTVRKKYRTPGSNK